MKDQTRLNLLSKEANFCSEFEAQERQAAPLSLRFAGQLRSN